MKWFSRAKGYGFNAQANGLDAFLHYSAVQGEGYRNLKTGQQVEFTIDESPKGLKAPSSS